MKARTLGPLVISLMALVLLTASPPARATAAPGDGGGTFTSGSIPTGGGFGLVVFGGGTFDQLVAAGGCPTGTAVAFWTTNTAGDFVTFVPSSTVGAVNAGFAAQFPTSSIPANTALIGRCAPTTASLQVTLSDDRGTLIVRVGDTFLLNLGDAYNWAPEVADTSVVSRVVNVTVIRSAQGLYRANKIGTTTLSATGGLNCPPATPCPALARLFSVTIVVR